MIIALSNDFIGLSINKVPFTCGSIGLLGSSGNSRSTLAQREKSNIFFSLLTWTPLRTPGVSKDLPLSTKLGFGGLVL